MSSMRRKTVSLGLLCPSDLLPKQRESHFDTGLHPGLQKEGENMAFSRNFYHLRQQPGEASTQWFVTMQTHTHTHQMGLW